MVQTGYRRKRKNGIFDSQRVAFAVVLLFHRVILNSV